MIHRMKIMPVSPASIKAGHLPKYTFHIAKFDEQGNHRGFVTQTPELIKSFNAQLQELNVDILTEEPKPRLDQMPLGV